MGTDRPLIYRLDARVWLRELSLAERRPVRLDSVPGAALDALADVGFSWVCLAGLWENGIASREIHRRRARSLEELTGVLPDLDLSDIDGSPYAVTSHRVRGDLGGCEGLESLRLDLARRELGLIVEVDPSRVGVDHPWTREHPEFFVRGDPGGAGGPAAIWTTPEGRSFALAREAQGRHSADGRHSAEARPSTDGQPAGYRERSAAGRPSAGGRYSLDALQLNHRHAGLRRAMAAELARVADAAGGIWIRHADELAPSFLQAAWGSASDPSDGSPPAEAEFLQEALPTLRASAGRTLVVLEGEGGSLDRGSLDRGSLDRGSLDRVGADLVVDARLRDLLAERDASAVRDHLVATRTGPQRAYLSSLEAEGRPRAARAFAPERYSGAALVAALAPGGVVVQDGQIEGRRVAADPRLSRRADEPRDREIEAFHQSILEILARAEVARGEATIPAVREGWEGNATWRQFIAILHRGGGGEILLTAVNYGPSPAQAFVDLSSLEIPGHEWTFQDILGLAVYRRGGDDLRARGLYLDVPAWDYHVFEVTRARPA